jgi:hypothetical protein
MPAWREQSTRHRACGRKPSRLEPIDRVHANGGDRRDAPASDNRLAVRAQIRSLRSNPLRLGMQPSLTLYWL